MAASMISLPMVSSVSRGGMQVIMESVEFRGDDRSVPLQRGRTINLDAAAFQDLDETVKCFVALFDRFSRTGAPCRTHRAVDRHLFPRWQVLPAARSCCRNGQHDNVLQRIPVVPRELTIFVMVLPLLMVD